MWYRGKQQNLLATNQQAFKEELMKEVAKKVECGVPCELKNENKNEPPGLSWGGDDRELGRKETHRLRETRKRAQRKLLAKRNRPPNDRWGER